MPAPPKPAFRFGHVHPAASAATSGSKQGRSYKRADGVDNREQLGATNAFDGPAKSTAGDEEATVNFRFGTARFAPAATATPPAAATSGHGGGESRKVKVFSFSKATGPAPSAAAKKTGVFRFGSPASDAASAAPAIGTGGQPQSDHSVTAFEAQSTSGRGILTKSARTREAGGRRGRTNRLHPRSARVKPPPKVTQATPKASSDQGDFFKSLLGPSLDAVALVRLAALIDILVCLLTYFSTSATTF